MKKNELIEIILDHDDIKEMFGIDDSREILDVELLDEMSEISFQEADTSGDFQLRKNIRIIMKKGGSE